MPSSFDITDFHELGGIHTENKHLLDTSATRPSDDKVLGTSKAEQAIDEPDVQLLDDNDASSNRARPGHLLKKTISIGLAIAFIVFVINLAVLIWALTRSKTIYGSSTFYEGNCATSRHISFAISLLINLLSTLLLAASNNAGQYVSSPTRAEIDTAHDRGQWLYIGSFSFRNLRYIGWKRILLWLGFMCTSFPLHLLWNAVVLETSSSNVYAGFLVTEDFLDPSSYFNQTLETTGPALGTGNLASVMKANASSLTVLDNAQCLQAYDVGFQSAWSNLLVVVDGNASSPNWLDTITYTPLFTGPSPQWLCGVYFTFSNTIIPEANCDVGALLEDPSNWHLPMLICEYYSPGGACLGAKPMDLPVKYCLAEPAQEHCSLEVLPELLLVVLVCNTLKIVLFCIVLRYRSFHPVAIIGDAISSFLESSDGTTVGLGPITAKDARKRGAKCLRHGSAEIRKQPWKSTRKGWGRAATRAQWICMDIFFVLVIGITVTFVLVRLFSPRPTNADIREGFGVTPNSQFWRGATNGTIQSALSTNLGQLAASALYLASNSVLTRMLAANELHAFATPEGRKTLRTSFPLRGQRAAFFLHVPLRYAVPVMASMVILHFFISQAVFPVRMDVYDFAGNFSAQDSFVGFIASFDGVLSSVVWATTLMFVVHGLACRPLNKDMPLMAGNSLAISAACHPPQGDTDAATKPVAYGVYDDDEGSVARAGFTSHNVGTLQEGTQY